MLRMGTRFLIVHPNEPSFNLSISDYWLDVMTQEKTIFNSSEGPLTES